MKTYVLSGLIFAMMLFCTGVYFAVQNYSRQQAVIVALEQERAALRQSIETTIETLEEQSRLHKELIAQIESTAKAIESVNQFELLENEKFDDHDLNALATAKPELIEGIINRGSDALIECIEQETSGQNEDDFSIGVCSLADSRGVRN